MIQTNPPPPRGIQPEEEDDPAAHLYGFAVFHLISSHPKYNDRAQL